MASGVFVEKDKGTVLLSPRHGDGSPVSRYFKRENSNYPEYYVYDPNGRLQAIAAAVNLSLDGTTLSVMYPITQYIWGPDRVLAKIDKTTNKSYYYLYNGHGDVVQIVDTSGTVKNTYDYDVWGNFLKKEETIENHFTYFGQTYDETTGLYYLRARYYDPTTGRFTQQDPAEDGYNWYVYGNQNPLLFMDPEGTDAIFLTNGNAVNSQDYLNAAPNVYMGHTAVIAQNSNGEWYYFSWGQDYADFIKVDSWALESLDNFNNWLGIYQYDYTTSTYIGGDFSKSVDYFEEVASTYVDDTGKSLKRGTKNSK